MADLIELYRPSRVLRSTNSHLLAVPSCPKCSFASRAFCVSLPNNWNSLPLHIRCSDSLATFQSRLKSHLFASAYHVYSLTCQCLRFDLRLLAVYNYFTDTDIDLTNQFSSPQNQTVRVSMQSLPMLIVCTFNASNGIRRFL